MPSTRAPRAPSGSCVVASGGGVHPAADRACPIIAAVRAAVPDGASTLSGWCSSMTSTDSKKGAALAANDIMSSAPMAKFGAMRTPTPAPVAAGGASASWARRVSSRASSHPVVPTTT